MYKILGADQKEYGPEPAATLRQWIAEGRINSSTLVMAEGAAQWVPISSLPEFAAAFAAPPPMASACPAKPPAKTSRLARGSRQLGIASLLAIGIGFSCFPIARLLKYLLENVHVFQAALLVSLVTLVLAGPIGLAAVICGYAAKFRIAKSHGSQAGLDLAKTGRRCGWISFLLISSLTLGVIIVYVMASPTANKNACISQLRQIDGAKEQWSLEKKMTATDTPTWNDLIGTGKYINIMPVCRSGGKFTINDMSTKPICSIPGHTLP